MDSSLESILGSVDPESIVKSGNQMVSFAFPPGKEMSEEELVNSCYQQTLGKHMIYVGNNIQSSENQRNAFIFSTGKLDDPPPGYTQNVLGPTFRYIIRTSHNQELIDSSLYSLATLHIRGNFFEGLSVEERYKLSTGQTVAIADVLMKQVTDKKVYDQWTQYVREPWMKRRESRGC